VATKKRGGPVPLAELVDPTKATDAPARPCRALRLEPELAGEPDAWECCQCRTVNAGDSGACGFCKHERCDP